MDRRLEAVVGRPLLVAREYAAHVVPSGSTLVVAGRHVPNQNQGAQLLAQYHNGARWSALLVTGSGVMNVINMGEAPVYAGALQLAHTADTVTVHITATDHRRWVGPIAAAIYDRVLTDREARAVVRHLAHYLH